MAKKLLGFAQYKKLLQNKPSVFAIAFIVPAMVIIMIMFAVSPHIHTPPQAQITDKQTALQQKVLAAKAKLTIQSQQQQMASLDLMANPNKKADLAPKLQQLAADRKQNLLTLIKYDPVGARQFVLSNRALATLASSGAAAEQPASLTGVFGFVQTDDENGDYIAGQITTADGKSYIMSSDASLSTIRFGSKIKVNGYVLDNQFLLAAKPGTETPDPLVVAPDVYGAEAGTTVTQPLTVLAAAAPNPTTGPIQDVVMFANFSGGATTSVDEASMKALYNGTPGKDLASWVNENSYGKASLSVDYYSLGNFPTISCSDKSSQTTAMKAALDAVSTKAYQIYTYISNCPDYGTASKVSNNPPTIMISAVSPAAGHIHELAHTLGSFLNHSGYLDCGSDAFIPPQSSWFNANPCVGQEYQDKYDVLGDGPHGEEMGVGHKMGPGWLDATQVATVNTTGTFTYKLAPYENPGNLVALMIPRGNSGSYFTVEYRQKIGFDANIGADCSLVCNATQGGLVRLGGYSYQGTGGGADQALIDTTPESVPRSSGWWPSDDGVDATLLPGKTFTDPEYGITITTNSADATGLGVTVTVPSVCTRSTATLSGLSPLSQTVRPGGSATYSVTLKNNDSAGCKNTDYRFRSAASTLFGGKNSYMLGRLDIQTNPAYFTLAPGESKQVSIIMASRADTPDGSYGRSISGTYSNLGYFSASSYGSTDILVTGAALVVDSGADTVAPTAPTNVKVSVLGATTAVANWSPSSDNTAVVGYKIIVNGGNLFTSTQPNMTNIALSPNTVYTYSITAMDRAGNESPAATASFTTPAKTITVAPTAPGNVMAFSTANGVKISWQPSYSAAGAFQYIVSPYDASKCSQSISTTQVIAPCLQPNFQYAYPNEVNVVAVDVDGNTSIRNVETPAVTTLVYGDAEAPTQPQGLYISSYTTAGTVIKWQPSTDDKAVAGYNVYAGATKIGYTADTTYTDTAHLNPGSIYRVQAVDTEGSVSQFSTYVHFSGPSYPTNPQSPDTIAPSASISSLTNGAGVSGTLSLTANASDNVGISKVIYMLDGQYIGEATAAPYTLALDTTKYADGTHQLSALAVDSVQSTSSWCCSINAGSSGVTMVSFKNMPADTTAPSVPTNISAAAVSPWQVNLTWNASSDTTRVAHYSILRNGVTIGTTDGPAFTDLTAQPGTPYVYSVAAIDINGNASAASSTASATTPSTTVADTTPPTQPTSLTAVAASQTQINLSWVSSTDNTGVAGYDIYRNGTKVATATTTSYGDTGLTSSTAYSYYVIARDAAGNSSPASITVSATTQATTQTATPTTVQGVVTDTNNVALLGAIVSVRYGGATHSFTTDASGRYTITNIPAGTYTFKYSMKNYTGASITLTVQANQTLMQNVSLTKSGKK